MNPAMILNQSAADGVILSLSASGTLKANGDKKQVDKWLPVIRDHKPALVALLSANRQTTGRTANFAEAEELRHLIAAIYQNDTEADRQEALHFALADPDDALTCYRAIALERGIQTDKPTL
jgi:hypothetical protein